MGARVSNPFASTAQRLGALGAATLGLLIATSAAAAPPHDPARRLDRLAHPAGSGDVIVIAHRACWKDTAENSLAAVRACQAMGADGVEFDVRHSRDGVAVVMHDETVDRMTNGQGRVEDLTLAQLKALRLRRGAGGREAPLTEETVPTLAEYLAAARGELWLVFDVKDGTQAESFAIAKAQGVVPQAIFFYECRNDGLLNRIRGFWNKVVVFPISFETDGPLSNALASCPSHPANLMHTKWGRPGFLEAARKEIAARRERVWIATMFPEDVAGDSDRDAAADPDRIWGAPIRAGANMIMTNEPAALLAYLRKSMGR